MREEPLSHDIKSALARLGQAITSAPLDGSDLPELLEKHVPALLPSSRVEIRLFPDRTLARVPGPSTGPPVPAKAWEWMREIRQVHYFPARTPLPWDGQPAPEPVVVAPVLGVESGAPIGGIYVTSRRGPDADSLPPAVQALAVQVSSALHGAQIYAQARAHQRVEQELVLAGEIQASFLPHQLPDVPGWQLAVKLVPARETSGDFYDVIPLPNGRLGLLVADVTDKGMGAALYMALSRTLIRTYAIEHHTRPDFALRVANNRILTDAQVDLFVTIFYGVLDPFTGQLTYCNAGHNPPYLLGAGEDGSINTLDRTGMPLGIFRGETWEQKTVHLDPGDALLLYSDGITEAQDDGEAFFGKERLQAVAKAHRRRPAQEIQAAVMAEVQAFVGDAPQFDDITMMVLTREDTPWT